MPKQYDSRTMCCLIWSIQDPSIYGPFEKAERIFNEGILGHAELTWGSNKFPIALALALPIFLIHRVRSEFVHPENQSQFVVPWKGQRAWRQLLSLAFLSGPLLAPLGFFAATTPEVACVPSSFLWQRSHGPSPLWQGTCAFKHCKHGQSMFVAAAAAAVPLTTAGRCRRVQV